MTIPIAQEEKCAALTNAVINQTPERLAEIYKELGGVEMSAIALGTACRFCGVESVRTLVEYGATFEIPKTEDAEKLYHCYSGFKDENYRSDFSLYLLRIFKHIKGACCFKGLKLSKNAVREDKKKLAVLPDSERERVLEYLCANAEKISFSPSEMLFYAIFAEDEFIVSELKRRGVTLSETRVKYITEGGAPTHGYWYEWCSMISSLTTENFIPIMEQIRREVCGKFYYSDSVFHRCEKFFTDSEIFEYFLENFRQERMNKTQTMRGLIVNEAIETFPVVEKLGWLANPKKRDEMIQYAADKGKTECAAWLMDLKNRTADFAAECEKEEKKTRRILNAAPNSVTALKQIWSYKKLEDGTLKILNYKGSSTEVTVPETIGKSTVTVIGNGAFTTASGHGGVVFSNASFEQVQIRMQITRVTLPRTLKLIDVGAFDRALSLKEIEIPDGVEEICDSAFYDCNSLTSVIIPGSVKRIGEFAFASCKNLRTVIIRDGVEELGGAAFYHNPALESAEVPASVKKLGITESAMRIIGVFSECPKLSVICPKGSKTESYCADFGYRVVN